MRIPSMPDPHAALGMRNDLPCDIDRTVALLAPEARA